MKLAILIQCHKNPEQINRLLERLDHPSVDCFVHIDKKQKFADQIIKRKNVYVLSESERVSVEWAQISQVTATLNLLTAAYSTEKYDYYWLISGQDWPLVAVEKIVDFFENHKGSNFVQFWNSTNHGTNQRNSLDKRNELYFPLGIIGRKLWQKVVKRAYVEITGGYNKTWKIFLRQQPEYQFYFGSAWWALNRETVEWMKEYLEKHEEYYNFYRNAVCPDESFFHTLVMLSPYANENTDFLTYVRFQKGANSPDILTQKDYAEAVNSKYLVMRKVDMDVDDFFVNC